MSKDPTRFEGGDTNLYSYLGGDPLNGVDLAGTDSIKEWWCRHFPTAFFCPKPCTSPQCMSFPHGDTGAAAPPPPRPQLCPKDITLEDCRQHRQGVYDDCVNEMRLPPEMCQTAADIAYIRCLSGNIPSPNP